MDADVILKEIQFNHDRHGATHDAFNIRFNEANAVELPEWRRPTTFTARQCPAAYAINETRDHTLTIKATFTTRPSVANATILIRAVQARPAREKMHGCNPFGGLWSGGPAFAARRANVLGEIVEREITFDERGQADLEEFELQDVLIWEAGVSVSDTEWRWQFREKRTDRWTDFALTRHRIYTVLQIPNCPWQQYPLNETELTQLPWADALEYACDWAAGAQDVDEAATLVTQNVHDLGLSHFNYEGSPSFYSCPNFNCTAFLKALNGGTDIPRCLNCSDCATVVSSFANLLGCDLRQLQFGPCSFNTNPIKLISRQREGREAFNGHEVAWKGSVTDDGIVFDACLQLDGDSQPDTPPFSPLLPTGIRLASASDRDGYRFHFFPQLLPRANTLTCRKIGLSALTECGSDDCKPFLAEKFNFEFWSQPEAAEAVSPLGDSLADSHSGPPVLTQWTLVLPVQRPKLVGAVRTLQSVWTHVTESEAILRLDVFELASSQEAHDFLLKKLGEFFQLDVEPLTDPAIGNISFADAEYTTILFAHSQFLALVRSAGREPLSILETAIEARHNLLALANL